MVCPPCGMANQPGAKFCVDLATPAAQVLARIVASAGEPAGTAAEAG